MFKNFFNLIIQFLRFFISSLVGLIAIMINSIWLFTKDTKRYSIFMVMFFGLLFLLFYIILKLMSTDPSIIV
uniref:hypothetical protein n=1 Tax=Glaucosphaera vacuolata TaxID=38265 RepID=UPI001FCD4E65|nr:hypothetical protein MW444_pgp178 [Glaucosphaera vacuolata]UNJ18582.1 hypothetical protein [Glaucosphaera vacuolata]